MDKTLFEDLVSSLQEAKATQRIASQRRRRPLDRLGQRGGAV